MSPANPDKLSHDKGVCISSACSSLVRCPWLPSHLVSTILNRLTNGILKFSCSLILGSWQTNTHSHTLFGRLTFTRGICSSCYPIYRVIRCPHLCAMYVCMCAANLRTAQLIPDTSKREDINCERNKYHRTVINGHQFRYHSSILMALVDSGQREGAVQEQ